MDLTGEFAAIQIAFALLAALGSAFVRGLTGFGMAILLVPVLALVLTPVEAVLVANVLSLLIGLSEIRRLVRNAERSARTIIALVVLATPAGLLALSLTSPQLARLLIAAIALAAFLAVLLPRRATAAPGHLTTGGVGIASGLLTGYAGMPGPPVIPYYVGRDMPRETAKASMMLIFTAASATGLVSGTAMGLLTGHTAVLGLLLFPAVLAGNWLGNRVSGRVGDRTWRIFVGVTLAGAALAALVKLV
ncbi:sulfite exporter TauE/SafE family protein [Aurantiacibacter spongiae]|uniref:Probable membrane transporter protein n=1 Tax=Aurantiacibacter spongiae TaxID=2488860 RepID=A0A3N5CXT2_9SPHN|nr:sulfite exporter TauE/SafE family protein [Aurantiacibacter spongiae]RPF71459.1 sulfite exporter TauE/SafE family protein [Aurantiacibacter spongiae]